MGSVQGACCRGDTKELEKAVEAPGEARADVAPGDEPFEGRRPRVSIEVSTCDPAAAEAAAQDGSEDTDAMKVEADAEKSQASRNCDEEPENPTEPESPKVIVMATNLAKMLRSSIVPAFVSPPTPESVQDDMTTGDGPAVGHAKPESSKNDTSSVEPAVEQKEQEGVGPRRNSKGGPRKLAQKHSAKKAATPGCHDSKEPTSVVEQKDEEVVVEQKDEKVIVADEKDDKQKEDEATRLEENKQKEKKLKLMLAEAGMHLCEYAEQGKSRKIRELCELGANPDTANSNDLVALKVACENQKVKAVQALMDAKADVNLESKGVTTVTGAIYTALHLAAGTGNEEIVNILIAAGANPLIKNSRKQTPSMTAEAKKHHGVGKLLRKIEHEYEAKVRKLISG